MPQTVSASLKEYARGLAGGLLFSLPLLYTMEMWWMSFVLTPSRLLAGVIGTFILLLAYNYYAGLHEDHQPVEVVIESIEELGLGLVVSAAALWLLGRFASEMSIFEAVAKTIMEGLPVAIGFSVGTAQLGGRPSESGMAVSRARSEGKRGTKGPEHVHGFGRQVILALCGAVLFAANVAPTDEIVKMGAEISDLGALAICAASVLLAMLTLFYSDFRGAADFSPASGPLTVVVGAIVCYGVACLSAAAMLWFVGRFEDVSPVVMVTQMVILAFPATLGASAGRFLLQQ